MINLEKLKPTKAVGIILSISQISVILLAIFLLNRPLFLLLNLWQLLGVCIGIASPSLFAFSIFYTLAFTIDEVPRDKDEREAIRWTFAGYMGTPIWAVGLLLSYLLELPLRQFCIAMVIGHGLLVITAVLIGFIRDKKKKKS